LGVLNFGTTPAAVRFLTAAFFRSPAKPTASRWAFFEVLIWFFGVATNADASVSLKVVPDNPSGALRL
jgi:hypothetical protein